MPRLIFSSRYLKPESGGHKTNLVNYIATRDGVEFADDAKCLLPATKKQEQIIAQIVGDFPDVQNTHEYKDYISSPTRKNASEFISQAIENNIDQIGKRKNYVDYIANRPRVEKIGTHGLFTDDGLPFLLSQVADEVSAHTGNVWTNIVSLRREDAARLGFDNVEAWQSMMRAHRNDIAVNMKISPENLRWFASFHNESHHPHVHLIAYSTKPKEGYLNEQGIEKLRSAFARDIFQHDLIEIYEKQTEHRDTLFEQAHQTVRDMVAEMQSGAFENKAIEELMLILADRLQKTGGKKVYGYLKADVKAIVNQIVDELAKDERVSKCYAAWYEMRNEVLHTYADTLPDPLPLSQQKELGRVRQIVINEALKIGSHGFAFEPDDGMDANIYSNDHTNAESFEFHKKSAAQGNVYESFSLDHMHGRPSALLSATRLMQQLGKIFEDSAKQTLRNTNHTDRKARRKEREKKIAQGHAQDDYAQEQNV